MHFAVVLVVTIPKMFRAVSKHGHAAHGPRGDRGVKRCRKPAGSLGQTFRLELRLIRVRPTLRDFDSPSQPVILICVGRTLQF